MEDLNCYHKKIGALRHQAAKLLETVEILQQLFAQEAENRDRGKRVQMLDGLQAEVAREIAIIEQTEAAASSEYSKNRLECGIINFVVGSIMSSLFHTRESPLSCGAYLAQNELLKKAPFGSVVLAVGAGGVPDDVQVIDLSRRARQMGRTEADVITELESKGYQVMTPNRFNSNLNKSKEKLREGTFPIHGSESGMYNESLS